MEQFEGSAHLCTALVEAGIDADAANKDGDTALFLAARAGALGVCKALVEAGADVLRRNSKNRTPGSQLKLDDGVKTFLAEAEDAARAARALRDKMWGSKLSATQTQSACVLRSV